MSLTPPTVAHLQTHGVHGVFVMCTNLKCRHLGTIAFEAIGTAPKTPFPALASKF
jgi:hypothetical protein